MTSISNSINPSPERASKSQTEFTADWISSEGERGLVSIVVPTYNRKKLLAECLKSLLEQTYRPLEIIVVENGTEAQAKDVVAKLAESAAEEIDVIYLHRPGGGAQRARNLGAMESRGEFLVFMDDDDVASVDFISSRVAAMESVPNANLAYGSWMRFIPKGSEYQLIDMKDIVPVPATPWQPRIRFLLQGTLIRRELVRRVGPWKKGLRKSQDLDYKARLLSDESCVPVHTSNGIVFYRLHGDSITGKLDAEKMDNYVDVVQEVEALSIERDDYEANRLALAEFLWANAMWLYAKGDFARGNFVLRRARFHCPGIYGKQGAMTKLLHRVGLEYAIGPLYYLVSRCKRKLGLSQPKIEATVTELPTTASLSIS